MIRTRYDPRTGKNYYEPLCPECGWEMETDDGERWTCKDDGCDGEESVSEGGP